MEHRLNTAEHLMRTEKNNNKHKSWWPSFRINFNSICCEVRVRQIDKIGLCICDEIEKCILFAYNNTSAGPNKYLYLKYNQLFKLYTIQWNTYLCAMNKKWLKMKRSHAHAESFCSAFVYTDTHTQKLSHSFLLHNLHSADTHAINSLVKVDMLGLQNRLPCDLYNLIMFSTVPLPSHSFHFVGKIARPKKGSGYQR